MGMGPGSLAYECEKTSCVTLTRVRVLSGHYCSNGTIFDPGGPPERNIQTTAVRKWDSFEHILYNPHTFLAEGTSRSKSVEHCVAFAREIYRVRWTHVVVSWG